MGTRQSFMLCDQCLVHIAYEAHELTVSCPFCHGTVERRAAPRALSEVLRGRGAQLASALGALMGLSGGVACQKNTPPTGDIYGGPPIEIEEPVKDIKKQEDAGSPQAPMRQEDMGVMEQDAALNKPTPIPSPPVSIYGGPPVDEPPMPE